MMTYIILVIAIIFLIISLALCFTAPTIASTILNFFSTVIVSWLISNLANERTFKKKQEDLAKVSHRHLGDVEKSALSIEQSIKDYTYSIENELTCTIENSERQSKSMALLFLRLLDSRMDDLKDRIKSTNRDWYDLLSEDVKRQIDKAEDPEASFSKSEIPPKPDLSSVANVYKDVADSDKAANG